MKGNREKKPPLTGNVEFIKISCRVFKSSMFQCVHSVCLKSSLDRVQPTNVCMHRRKLTRSIEQKKRLMMCTFTRFYSFSSVDELVIESRETEAKSSYYAELSIFSLCCDASRREQ